MSRNLSAEMEEIVRSAELCQEEVRKLKHWAINRRSISAAIALIDAAVDATQAVHALWFERRTYNPFAKSTGTVADLAARREMLGFWVGTEKPFPILHTWQAPIDPRQDKVLRALQFGRLSGREKRTPMKSLLKVVIRAFEEIQHDPKRPAGIEGRIWDLPPLSQESRADWADAIVEWLWSKPAVQRRLRTPGMDLYRLARPERELKRDERKAKNRLKEQTKKWKKADGGWPLGWVNATKWQERNKRILKMQVTAAHVRNGLKAEICSYWKRNLMPDRSAVE